MFLRSVFVLFVLSGATAFAQVEVPARAVQQTKATAVQDPVQGGWEATPAAFNAIGNTSSGVMTVRWDYA